MLEHTRPVEGPKARGAAPGTKAPRSRWRWVWFPVLLLAGAGVWYLWSKGSLTPTAAASGTAGKSGKKGSGAVPVVAVKAFRGNIGVYIDGLGSVTPIYTDTVKSLVDGELMSVHFKEGDIVHKGDLLIEIDKRPYQAALKQAEGNLARDQAILANAKVDLERYTGLEAKKAVPEQTLATQKALVAQYEGVVKYDQGIIDADQLNLTYCDITARITGRVGLRLVDPGNIVHASDTNGMLVITQIQPISVIFTVAEDDLPKVLHKLAAGQHLQAEAWDRNKTTKIGNCTLDTVDNQIDPTTGSLRLRATCDNSQNELFPNQFVNIRLLLEEDTGVTLVNRAVIQQGNTTNPDYVYLVTDKHTATVRVIEEGVKEGDDVQITSGVKPGDTLVMTGTDKLTEGTPVTVAMADEGGKAGGKSGGKKK